jgi:hypothetical protein
MLYESWKIAKFGGWFYEIQCRFREISNEVSEYRRQPGTSSAESMTEANEFRIRNAEKKTDN